MAKPGPARRAGGEPSAAAAATKEALVAAAIETLKTEGFAGSSARVIAAKAGCNQALIFYHFGSVVRLLLAALDEVSALRLARYSAAMEQVHSPTQLLEVATSVFREDLDAGYVTVLVEMIAGASSTPGLGPEIAGRIAPWTEFARRTIDTALNGSGLAGMVPTADVAHGVVAFYLGLELLTHLDGNQAPALALLDHAQRLAGVAQVLGAWPAK